MFSYYSLSGGGVRVRIQVICNAKNLRLVYTIRSGRNNLKTADNLRTTFLSSLFIPIKGLFCRVHFGRRLQPGTLTS